MACADERVIETKLPLTWLIGCAAAIIFSLGGVSFQVSTIAATVSKIEVKSDLRDDRLNTVVQSVAVQANESRNIQSQVTQLGSQMVEVRRDVEAIKDKQRWVPGKHEIN